MGGKADIVQRRERERDRQTDRQQQGGGGRERGGGRDGNREREREMGGGGGGIMARINVTFMLAFTQADIWRRCVLMTPSAPERASLHAQCMVSSIHVAWLLLTLPR